MTKIYNKGSILIIISLIIVLVAGGFLAFRYFKPVPSGKEALKPTIEKLFTIPLEYSLFKEESGVGGGEIEYPVSGEEHYDFSFYHIYFSPNNKHFAYAVAENGTYFFVVDGQEEKKYDEASGFTFSPDSEHYAYAARKNKEGYIIFDGMEQKKYNWVESPTFSPDSERFAYVAIDTGEGFGFYNQFIAHAAIEGRYFVISDGKEQKKYERIFNLTFSPDSKHFAYTAKQGENWLVVFDGTEQKKYNDIGELTFSPDGKHFAYTAKQGGSWFVVFDGVEQKKYDGRTQSLTFSFDGKHFAYDVEEKKEFIVLDGKEQKKYDLVYSSTFSPDGKRFAYIAAEEEKRFAILDGKEQKKYDLVIANSLVFSPDNKRFAYIAREDGEEFIVLDGKKHEKRDLVINSCLLSEFEFVITTHVFPPIFSPDSKHFAYIAEEEGKQFVILDNVEQQKQYGLISKYRFDSESKYLLYNGIIIDQGVWSVAEEVK